MPWREEEKLADYDDDQELEVTCAACSKHRYEWARTLKREGRMAHLYIDEVQNALVCIDKHCAGQQRIAKMHDDRTGAFTAGMPIPFTRARAAKPATIDPLQRPCSAAPLRLTEMNSDRYHSADD